MFRDSSWENINKNLNITKNPNSILHKNNKYNINYDRLNEVFFENDKINFECTIKVILIKI